MLGPSSSCRRSVSELKQSERLVKKVVVAFHSQRWKELAAKRGSGRARSEKLHGLRNRKLERSTHAEG